MSTLRSRRARMARLPIMRMLLHPAVTLACLVLLFALVLLGTLHQTEHGLHAAQKMYFDYGIAWVAGVLPLPSAGVVLWVLSAQLLLTVLFVLPMQARKAGLWIVHLGLLALMVGGFITERLAVESQLTLAEGETGHFTTAYHEFELAFWEREGDTNRVTAYDAGGLKPGRTFTLEPYGARLAVRSYYENCDAFRARAAADPEFISASGIGFIEPRKPEKEVTHNTPGVTFTISEREKAGKDILLFGGEVSPLMLDLDGRRVFCQLRRKHYPLDFSVTLTEFVRKVHPGTQIASDFESYVDIGAGSSVRSAKIWMNNPLRYRGLTFFQASFSQGPGGPEQSTFAVVTNPGRLLPYVSSIVIFAGLLLYFLTSMVSFLRRKEGG